MRVFAPWTEEQVRGLQNWQSDDNVHPYVYNTPTGQVRLVPTPDGWVDGNGLAMQDWAHDFSLRWKRPGTPKLVRYDRDPQGSGEVGIVVPTRDVHTEPFVDVVGPLSKLGDVIAVVSSGPGFRFGVSVNEGIKAALKDGYRRIGISNDDLRFPSLDRMREMISHAKGEVGYTVPYVNGVRAGSGVSTNVAGWMYWEGMKNLAPGWAIQKLNRIRLLARIHSMPNPWIFTHPRKGYLNVQPLAFFQDNVLQEDRFDEGLVNGMEDCELAYRLYRKRIFGKTDRRWTVNHLNHYSFRLNPEALQSDEHNLAYLWRKYPSVGKTGIVRSPP